MNDKFQRLAIKMVDLFPTKHFESPQECFDQFKVIWKQQYDYLSNFEASSLLKLIIYIYSYKNTGNFNLSDMLIVANPPSRKPVLLSLVDFIL